MMYSIHILSPQTLKVEQEMVCAYWLTVHEMDVALHSWDEPVSVEPQQMHRRTIDSVREPGQQLPCLCPTAELCARSVVLFWESLQVSEARPWGSWPPLVPTSVSNTFFCLNSVCEAGTKPSHTDFCRGSLSKHIPL